MTKRGAANRPASRAELEHVMSTDMRAVSAQSDRIGRHFARQNDVGRGDLHALLHMMVAEAQGTPLTLAELRQRLDVSSAAITYLADRMIEAGHVWREPDPADRRKMRLRFTDGGMSLGRNFFEPLGVHMRTAMSDLADNDLEAAHRVFTAMIAAMSTFEDQLHTAPAPSSTAARGKNAKDATSRARKPPTGAK